jgi:hypothetical protein
MPSDPFSEGDEDVSRRRLLEKAALAVGAATSVVVAARTALARSSDVIMDSAGRVLVEGTTLPQGPEGSFEEAEGTKRQIEDPNKACVNTQGCTARPNTGCVNKGGCAKLAPNRS